MTQADGGEFGTSSQCVPKLVGCDVELGNAIEGQVGENGSSHEAAQAVLQEIDGVGSRPLGTHIGPRAANGQKGEYVGHPDRSGYSVSGDPEDPQDIGRKYLQSNGGCVYIDLGHLEVCTPEVVSAFDFVAAWQAMLRIALEALSATNAKRPPGKHVMVLVNSSDGLDNAYGSHLNFLVTRRLWDDLFTRRLHPDLFVLAAHQVSSIVYTGQGKVGAENGRPRVAYQLAQRADFFDRLVGPQTTYHRPIVNSRDESLCGVVGEGAHLARLHCIFYDSTLCQVATLLKIGVMQIVLSMLEARRLDASLMLEDPVTALVLYSHDPGLATPARLVDGRRVTAVELQLMFCERARVYVDAGGCEGLVPEAPAILTLWEDTLEKLARRDFDPLAPRLDWVLKRAQIERALAHRGLDWSAPEAKHLDHIYANLDPGQGLYWALEDAGLTQTLIGDERIERFRGEPPDDTRAWTRAMLLRHLPRERITRVDWDRIELAPTAPQQRRTVIPLPDPLGYTRETWALARGNAFPEVSPRQRDSAT